MNQEAINRLQRVHGFATDVPFSQLTTFKIGGPAKVIVRPSTDDDLQKIYSTLKEYKVPHFVLGGGSNILASDEGFDGCVVIPNFQGCKNEDERVVVGAGVGLQKFLLECKKMGIAGFEHLTGIPGKIGGAIAGNAGPTGKWIDSCLESVDVFSFQDGSLQTYKASECGFAYRTSRFKAQDALCILRATFHGMRDDPENIQQRMTEFLKKRTQQPTGSATAGCAFKNPAGVSAGKIIDDLGLKGKKIGGAQISLDHGNFILNTGRATARDVITLISFIKQHVRDKLGIQLEEEIRYIGF